MKKTLLVLSSAFLFFVFTAGDCKKTNEPTAGEDPKPPSVQFSSPGTQDSCSIRANGIIAFANTNTTLLAALSIFPPQINGNEYTWPIPGDSLTTTVKAVRQGDDSFTWEIRFNGVEDGITYSNKLMLSGTTTSAAGTSGTMTAYDDASANVVGTFVWTTNNNEVSGTLIEKDSSQVDVYKIEIISNKTTTAGQVTTYTWSGTAWVEEFHASWAVEGGPAVCS